MASYYEERQKKRQALRGGAAMVLIAFAVLVGLAVVFVGLAK